MTGSKTFPWRRRWTPAGKEPPLDGDGFLNELAEEYWKYRPPVTKTLEDVADRPCLVLLGEAGAGKTTAVQQHAPADCILDLATVSSAGELREEIEDRLGSGNPELWLDSLDEARLRVPTVLDTLVRSLKRRGRDGPLPKLRIASRPGAWPADGEAKLRELFEDVGMFVLAPLQRGDVRLAAKESALDPGQFEDALGRAGVTALAAQPLTLIMLIEAFRSDAELPARAEALFENACNRLLVEWNRERQQRHGKQALDRAARRYVAERLAACAILGNRPEFLEHEPEPGKEARKEVLRPSEVVDGVEQPEGAPLRVTEQHVREVLSTGLFRLAGEGRFTFLHRSFAEYLAGCWLLRRKPRQRHSLLFLPGSDEIPPQLHGVAAWVAARDRKVLERVLRRDPGILLQIAHLLSEGDRKELVTSVLEACDRLDMLVRWQNRDLLGRLRHEGLAEQLRPWITGRCGGEQAREAAIDIAGACRCEPLASELLALVEDPEVAHRLRVEAMSALLGFGDKRPTEGLRRIALGDNDEHDPDERLRGLALWYLWPEHLSSADAMRRLAAPARSTVYGMYRLFWEERFPAEISPAELPEALRILAERLPDLASSGSEYESLPWRLTGALWQRALTAPRTPELVEAMAELWLALHRTELIWRTSDVEQSQLDEELRRALVEAVIKRCGNEARDAVQHVLDLARAEDLDWYMDRLEADMPASARSIWAALAVLQWHWARRPDRAFERLYRLAQDIPEVRNELGSWLEGCPVDGPEAEKLRERHRYFEEVSKEEVQHTRQWTCPIVRERVSGLLDIVEQGDCRGWWAAIRLLSSAEPAGVGHDPDSEGSWSWVRPQTWPAFRCLDETFWRRITDAALRYLEEADPGTEEPESWWREPGKEDWRARAGAVALSWLHDRAPEQFEQIPAEVWRRWAPAIVVHARGEGPTEQALVDACRRHAGDALASALCQRLRIELVSEHRCSSLLQLAERHPDPEVLDELGRLVAAPDVKPDARYEIGRILAANARHLPDPAQLELEPDARAAVLAGAVAGDCGRYWPALRAAMEGRPDLARKALVFLCDDPYEARRNLWAPQLDVAALVELYTFMHRHFELYAEWTGPRLITAEHEAARFGERIPERLAARGTAEAVLALEELGRKFPDRREIFAYHRRQALRLYAATVWQPAEPRELVRLEQDARTRVFRSDADLMELVLESLERLEDELQGRRGGTPLARSLWNEGPWRPKDENFLSDFVKTHLQRDLVERRVLANREVELRATRSADGQRTDILVQAVTRSKSEPFATVVVEVKGCWHRDLETAMRAQLRDRYLRDNGHRYGVYLVGWFVCDGWTGSKVAGRKARDEDTIGTWRSRLQRQAEELSSDGFRLRAFLLDATIGPTATGEATPSVSGAA